MKIWIVAAFAALTFTTASVTLMADVVDAGKVDGQEAAAQSRIAAAEAKANSLEALRPELASAQGRLEEMTKSLAEKQSALASIESIGSHSVTVLGIGRISSVPDVMSFQVGVNATRATAQEATSSAAQQAAEVVKSLKANGVRSVDIQTRFAWVGRYYYQSQNHFNASSSVAVKVRDMSKAGKIMSDAVAAGGDDATMMGVDFYFENNTEALTQARKSAMEAAKRSAAQYAELSGRQLGRVMFIQETSASAPPPVATPGRAAASSSAANALAAPIEPGVSDSEVRLSVVFELI